MATHEMEVLGGPGEDEVRRHVMAVMGVEGDVKVIWDADKEAEVDAAETQFNSLKKKGYVAFAVDKKGEAGKRLDKFDPEIEKMIMVPQLQGG